MSDDTDGTRFGKHQEQPKPKMAQSEATVQQNPDVVNRLLDAFDISDKCHLYIFSL